jgi:Xaa-Pro aminopeptidase
MSVAELDIYKKRFPKLSFFNIGTALSDFRAIKDADEIEFIKNAQKITDNAFLHILNFINKERTENEIALELEFYMRTNGADGIAFDTICVSGTKSSLPHGTPSDIKISENSFLTMDFGARFNGYCSDMTRTIVVGNASDKMLDVYFTVLKAQQLALDNITAGVLGCDVDRAARDYIYSHGYEGCFGHSTGHGLGIDVHEAPSFSPNYKKPIPNGAILSVEPGIYIEGKFGVRIEDIVIVKVDGYENLTKSQKQLIQI